MHMNKNEKNLTLTLVKKAIGINSLTTNHEKFISALLHKFDLFGFNEYIELTSYTSGFIACLNELGIVKCEEIAVFYDIANIFWNVATKQ